MTEPLTQKKLRYEIKEIEKVITGKQSRGEDTKFEEKLIKSYRKRLQLTTA